MNDQEFHPHIEVWLVAYYERNRLSRLIQANSAGMGDITLPKSGLGPDQRAGQTSCPRPIV